MAISAHEMALQKWRETRSEISKRSKQFWPTGIDGRTPATKIG